MWGEAQGATYMERIERAFRDLSQFPELGRAREEIFPGCRSYPVGEHVIYYEIHDTSITIIRILNSRMHATRDSIR
jgi:toxin ParE1/3/4